MTLTSPGIETTVGGRAALLTGAGPAAIAVVRLWGPRVPEFLARHVRIRSSGAAPDDHIAPVARATLLDESANEADDILLTLHPDRHDVRLHLHGNPVQVERLLQSAQRFGLAVAAPESDGSADGAAAGLMQPVSGASPIEWRVARSALEADAWARLPDMRTERGARWLLSQVALLDQSLARIAEMNDLGAARSACQALLRRPDVSDWFARPLRVALLGPPNAGKSSLINALTGQPVSVVAAAAGTTRDWVEAPSEVSGFPVCWLDTAGVRASADPLESAGIEMSERARCSADELIVVLDASSDGAVSAAAFIERYQDLLPACVALNKCDLWSAGASPTWLETLPSAWSQAAIAVSAERRIGLTELTTALLAGAGRGESPLVSCCAVSERQRAGLRLAADASDLSALRRAIAFCRESRLGAG